MGNFLIILSGVRPEILARCPTEKAKFQSLGWAILITSVMATISMWFALASVMGFNPFAAFPFAVIWGLIIMGIDRWLIISLPSDGTSRFWMALPRLVLAVLLGTVISTPIVLRIFQSEINNQISVIKENDAAHFLGSQQHSQVAQRVSADQKTVDNLQKVIDSRGQQSINSSSDPEVQGLTRQLTRARTTAGQDYKQWQCQLYGGCGAPKGSGPLAAASKARYLQDQQQVTQINREVQAREQQLRDNSAASQQSRLRQAQNALPSARAQWANAQGEENSLRDNFQKTNNASNGLLLRLKALDQLSGGNGTLSMARALLFLLFLVIECLPVTVKLLQRPGNYEKITASVAREELSKARKDIYKDRFSGEMASGAGTGRSPGMSARLDSRAEPTADYTVGSARSAGGRLDTVISGIWQTGPQPVVSAAGGRFADDSLDGPTVSAPGSAVPPAGPDGPTRYEEAMQRGVTDFGGPSSAADQGLGLGDSSNSDPGGIEHHYADDDL